MAKFAVLDGENIINIIVADSKEIAEEITGKICIEYTTQIAEPGGFYDGVDFIEKKPFPSWILNSNKQWKAPVPYPDDGKQYFWDEAIINWVEVPAIT
jgi:hypothetical protein